MPAAHSLHVAPLKPLALVQSQPQLPVEPVAVPPLRQLMVPAAPVLDTVQASAVQAPPLKLNAELQALQWLSCERIATPMHAAQLCPAPVLHINVSVHAVCPAFTSYPVLHALQWFATLRSAGDSHVLQAAPAPVVHMNTSLQCGSPAFIS